VAVTFPRDLIMEAYLGRWVNITALAESRSLRQVDPVTVTWGLPNEQGKALAPPSTAQGVLNNAGGHWTPENPLSDYYDYLRGRNVPTRLSLRVGQDAFTRTVGAGSWGAIPGESQQWSLSGVNTTFSVNGTQGVMAISAVSSFGVATFPDSYGDCCIAATTTVNVNDIAGGSLEPCNLVLRYMGSGPLAGEHYLLRVECTSAELLNVTIFHSSLGAISGTVQVAGLINAASPKALRAKFQVEGQTLRGKVYAPGPSNDPDQFEPLGWHVSCHHERLPAGFPGGFVGIRNGIAAGNSNSKPISFLVDDVDLRLLRHSGELAQLQPTWDEGHKIKKARFRAAGITQRLGRPQRPALSSAIRRYAASNAEFTTRDFWPLDEAATAPAQGLSAVAGGAAAFFERNTGVIPERGAITWGNTDKILTSVPGFVSMSNEGQLTFPINPAPLGTTSTVSWAMRLTNDTGGRALITTSVSNQFVFFFYTDATWELFRNPGSVSVATGAFTNASGWDGIWVTIGISLFSSGGNIAWRLCIDGVDIGGGSSVGGTYSPMRSLVLHSEQAGTGGQGDDSFSSVLVTDRRIDDILPEVLDGYGVISTVGRKISQVTKGWPGERAVARAFRLCAEEGVPFDYWGDLGQSRPMGPQRPVPLLDQLTECAEADGAFLYEPRYTAGVAIRARRTMCATTPTAAFSYSSGHVAPQFAPSADDRPSANLVRAENADGGFFILDTPVGVMNTKDPGTDPDAIGRSPADAKVNVDGDAQLPDVAGWVRGLGTVPEVRFPRVTINLRARELTQGADPTLPARQALLLNVGDRMQVTGLAAADVYRDLDQVVRGGTETYRNVRQHQVQFNTAPYERYRTGVHGDGVSRYDTLVAATTLDAQLTAGTTGARNVTTGSGPVWTTDAGAFPMDVVIGGERVTLSGITGTGAAQVMTISARAVNGVSKTHPAGTKVYLFQPVYYC